MAAVKGFSVRFRGKHLFFVNIPQILLYVFLGLFVCFTALPLIYVISTAFKPMDELFLYPPRFFVRNPTMSNFGDLFAALDAQGSAVLLARYADPGYATVYKVTDGVLTKLFGHPPALYEPPCTQFLTKKGDVVNAPLIKALGKDRGPRCK